MPEAIWKYLIPIEERFIILNLPIGAVPLRFEVQNKCPTLWVRVNPYAILSPRRFLCVGTGHEINGGPEYRYIGTCLMDDGALVWHLFEISDG